MTKNQIDYWNLQESKRANLARESETAKHNREVEKQGRDTIIETVTHNRNSERETAGHNRATEAQSSLDLLERSRSNRANEALTAQRNVNESNRLIETTRSNLANEAIGRSNASSNLVGANTKRIEAANNTGNLIVRQRAQNETERANRASEALRSEEIGAKTATDVLGTLGNFFGRIIGRRSTNGR